MFLKLFFIKVGYETCFNACYSKICVFTIYGLGYISLAYTICCCCDYCCYCYRWCCWF